MILLYNWLSAIYWTPGPLNSNLIKTEKAVPNSPENKAKIRYNVPISLAFEDKNHLSLHIDIVDFIPNIGIVIKSLLVKFLIKFIKLNLIFLVINIGN